MDLAEAVEKGIRILEDERLRPTLAYRYVSDQWPPALRYEEPTMRAQGYTPAGAGQMALVNHLRRKRPRDVLEDPKSYEFISVNYDLLLAIFRQVPEGNRSHFVWNLLSTLLQEHTDSSPNARTYFPSWNSHTSGMALLAEFCVRTQHTQALLKSTEKLDFPTYGAVIMLMEMEEIIALNFNLFSDAALAAMPQALAHLYDMADRQTYSARGDRGGPMVQNPHYRQGFSRRGEEIVKAIEGILKECQQARYWYLKGALRETPNLEIDDDKVKVIGFLDTLGFDPLLTSSLKKAEELYMASPDAFELKSCLGHLRSFYEHLHIDAGTVIAAAAGQTVVPQWDPILTFFKNKGLISEQQNKFARGLFGLLSDEGVHPLIAEREFARLLRNVVIEYGLMFLTMLDKEGIRLGS